MLHHNNLVAVATAIAISLAEDKSLDELNELKTLIGQINCTINSIYYQMLLELANKSKK